MTSPEATPSNELIYNSGELVSQVGLTYSEIILRDPEKGIPILRLKAAQSDGQGFLEFEFEISEKDSRNITESLTPALNIADLIDPNAKMAMSAEFVGGIDRSIRPLNLNGLRRVRRERSNSDVVVYDRQFNKGTFGFGRKYVDTPEFSTLGIEQSELGLSVNTILVNSTLLALSEGDSANDANEHRLLQLLKN